MQSIGAVRFACLLLAAMAAPVAAKVVPAENGGFISTQHGETKASPEEVWDELVHPERWWNKAHSWSGSAADFSMTVVPGGCFCEKLPNGGFAEHARVIFAEPPRVLRLSGAFGPLQGEALVGTLTIRISPGKNGATAIVFEYAVGGNSRLALQDIAPLVDGVMANQHGRLLKQAESRNND